MLRDSLDIKDLHVKPLKQMLEGLNAIVAEVLVIDSVKLHVLNEIEKVVRFRYKYTIVSEERFDGAHDFVKVVDMREHIVGSYHFRLPVRLYNMFRHFFVEELDDRLNALFVRDLCHITRWFNAE